MTAQKKLRFCDVFAGCGGLSLGLLEAGHEGVFAIEKSPLAFETLRFNLIDGTRHQFAWPTWLPKQAMTCEDLLSNFSEQVAALRGQVDLIVGGPPCQGFSTAGRRDPADPRNKMTEQYLALVGLLQPQFLVIENVAGFNMRFERTGGVAEDIERAGKTSYAKYIADKLDLIGYDVDSGLVNCADFGVPQIRHRYLMICKLKEDRTEKSKLFKLLLESSSNFLKSKGFPVGRHITTREAISDLETTGKPLIANEDAGIPGFEEAVYTPPTSPTAFQYHIRKLCEDLVPNSRRLARHKTSTKVYFKHIQTICRPGYCLSQDERDRVGTKKQAITVLDPNRPAPTITTLPDDILHYSEQRILTVRENARLQSFPDWFAFQGKYTTGGTQRKQECPRYTQVGNAVPPLLSEAIGHLLATHSVAKSGVLTDVV
ncbi:DNA cytosine methyltransferase [Chromobacterium haemolyticum]|uniref:DNA cytosine methyltransferase n=1 Tax=Chromobacterium haemolyticum TaxID=394935 RepID=UPI001745D63A|nr:DNA cytosine methyltransferase [Chromobacterium haemolyticum]QOD85122.1 DNA cytosine methyltransferase [Chromobacterium haemolyticum]